MLQRMKHYWSIINS